MDKILSIRISVGQGLCLESRESHLDRVSTGSGSDLVKSWESTIVRKYRMLITDQVATAPCTDPVQAHFLTFRAKLRRTALPQSGNGNLDRVSTGSGSDLVRDQHERLPNDSDSHRLTTSLSLLVLTRSKND